MSRFSRAISFRSAAGLDSGSSGLAPDSGNEAGEDPRLGSVFGGFKRAHAIPDTARWLICQSRIGGTLSRAALSFLLTIPTQYSSITVHRSCASFRSSSLAWSQSARIG